MRVKVLKDLNAVELIGRRVGPLISGQEVDLEPWEATVLERHGFVDPIQKLTLGDIRKLMLTEERSPTPLSLPEDFYAAVARRADHLRSEGQSDMIEELRAAVRALAEIRVQKLVRLALSPSNAGDLPPEERHLVNRLSIAIEEWEIWLNGLFEKAGEEVGGNDEVGGPVRHAAGDEAHIQKQGVPAPDVHT